MDLIESSSFAAPSGANRCIMESSPVLMASFGRLLTSGNAQTIWPGRWKAP